MTVPDPLAALVAFVAGDAEVAALVGARVFGQELPAGEVQQMPRPCVVLQTAGGFGERGEAPVQRVRVDARCYGRTLHEAMQVHLAVYGALRKRLLRSQQGDALLHSAILEGGPSPLRDPDADWPFVLSSWQIIAADEPVT